MRDLLRNQLGVSEELSALESRYEQERRDLEQSYSQHIEATENTVAMLQRQIEDFGLLKLNADADPALGSVVPQRDRVKEIEKARRIRHANPIAKRAITLLMHYVFGDGVGINPQDKEIIGPIIAAFLEDQDNRAVLTSPEVQPDLMDRLATDGELFIALFVGENGGVKVRIIPPEDVNEIVKHPEDKARPLLYRRKVTRRDYDVAKDEYKQSQSKTLYYRDIRNRYSDIENATDPVEVPPDKLGPAYILHVAINKQADKFGLSELFASYDWARELRDFMGDRVAINRAAATITHVRKVRGTPQAVKSAAAQIPGQLTGLGTNPMLPATHTPRAGWSVTGDNVDDKWLQTDTGAANAIEDARMLLMFFGAGVGIPVHWLGDGGDANLATASAMNDPVIRVFQHYQQFWRGVFRTLFQFVILEAVRAGEIEGAEIIDSPETGMLSYKLPLYRDIQQESPKNDQEQAQQRERENQPVSDYIDVDFPPVVPKQTLEDLQAVQILAALLPGANIEAAKVAVRLGLTALGVNEVEEIIEQVFYVWYELPETVALNAQNGQNANTQPGNGQTNSGASAGAQESIADVIRQIADDYAAYNEITQSRN